MIKFIENSDTKLKFVSYPIFDFCNRLIILLLLIPWLYWVVFLSPASSSLDCKRNVDNYVNCQLQKSNLLGFNVTKVNINDLRKIPRLTSGTGALVLRANPIYNRNLWPFYIVKFQETYFFPSSTSFAWVDFNDCVFFSNRNYRRTLKKGEQINQFIQGKLNQKILSIEQKITWIQLLIPGLFMLFIPFIFVVIIIKQLLNDPIKTIYEFDGKNKILIVHLKSILNNTIREYQFDSINQIRLDEDNTKNTITGRIILQFDPEYNYPIEEFVDMEYGKRNFQIIQEFLEQNIAILGLVRYSKIKINKDI